MATTVDNVLADLQRAHAELQQQLDESRAELARRNSEHGERIEQQPDTIDVLKVMSASLGDPLLVFDLIRVRDIWHRRRVRASRMAAPDLLAGGVHTGLGLSLSYDLVTKQHRGAISVGSEVAVFTEFTIRLPGRAAGDP